MLLGIQSCLFSLADSGTISFILGLTGIEPVSINHWTNINELGFISHSLTHSVQKSEDSPLGIIDTQPGFVWISH